MTTPAFKPLPWQPITLADAYQPRPPTAWVVEGLFAAASLNVLFGPPSSLKSLLALDMAASVVAGENWLPLTALVDDGFPTKQGAAVIIDFDNGGDTHRERLEAVGRAYQLAGDAPLYGVTLAEAGGALNLRKLGEAQALVGWLQQHGVQLAVIDNLRLISGEVDENAGEMSAVMANLRYVAETTPCALVVIHHERKTTPGGRKTRNGDSLRGHSSIEAAIDLALKVERDTNDPDVVQVSATKVRGAPVEDFAARFEYAHKPGSSNLAEARFWGSATGPTGKKAQAAKVLLEVLLPGLEIAKGDLVNRAKAQAGAGIGRPVLERALADLEKWGRVQMQIGANGAKLYSAVTDPWVSASLAGLQFAAV